MTLIFLFYSILAYFIFFQKLFFIYFWFLEKQKLKNNLIGSQSYEEKFSSKSKNDSSTRKAGSSIYSDRDSILKKVKSNIDIEEEIYKKAIKISNSYNIVTFKGSKKSNSDSFIIFFFNESPKIAQINKKLQNEINLNNSHKSKFQNNNEFKKPNSEYLTVKIYPKYNNILIQDCNVKESLKKQMGPDIQLKKQKNIISIETQIKSMIGHWLKLSNRVR